MEIDIVPWNSQYRGMGRILSVQHFNSQKAKKNFNKICEEYFKYLDLLYFQKESTLWENILSFYKVLVENEVECEVIAYDSKIINDVYGQKIEFLGLDIVKDNCESLIYYSKNQIDKSYLNENGLCNDLNSVKKIIEIFQENEGNWNPCWIYKINCER